MAFYIYIYIYIYIYGSEGREARARTAPMRTEEKTMWAQDMERERERERERESARARERERERERGEGGSDCDYPLIGLEVEALGVGQGAVHVKQDAPQLRGEWSRATRSGGGDHPRAPCGCSVAPVALETGGSEKVRARESREGGAQCGPGQETGFGTRMHSRASDIPAGPEHARAR